MNSYAVTVTLYVTGEDEVKASDKVHDVLNRAFNGIDDYSIDIVDLVEEDIED